MLNLDFNNGKKVNLLSALAVFTIAMGFLFFIAASSSSQTFAAVLLMLIGSAWYVGNRMYTLWEHHPSH